MHSAYHKTIIVHNWNYDALQNVPRTIEADVERHLKNGNLKLLSNTGNVEVYEYLGKYDVGTKSHVFVILNNQFIHHYEQV